jgi:hypothetical protein
MKRLPLLFILLFTVIGLKAQIPQGFSYQAIYRDSEGNSVSNQNVTVKFSIIDSIISGPNLYIEQHNSTTNEFGLITLTVGSGTVQTGNFSSINWTKNSKFLKVEINGTLSGITQLLSVPYAMVAGNGNSWKDTILTSNNGSVSRVLKAKDNIIVSFEPYNWASAIGYGTISLWSPYPFIDLKNQAEDPNHMRLTYDSSGTVGKIGISTLKNTNQWSWDQFVFTEDGNFGVSPNGYGQNIPKSRVQVSDGDIYIDSVNKGVIMKSPNGQCWRMTVSNSGQPVFNSITCP